MIVLAAVVARCWHGAHLVPLRHGQIFYLASDAVEGQPVVVPLLSAQ